MNELDDNNENNNPNNNNTPNNKTAILVRTAVLFVALINQLLMVYGYSILPLSEEEFCELFTALFTAVAAIWTWYTDNRLNS